jgi:uncharacterized protein YutE (UPF0331/DUF86 family)
LDVPCGHIYRKKPLLFIEFLLMKAVLRGAHNFREPNDYADTFRIMKEQALFDESFTAVLMQMARFRNRLVYIYWEVDVMSCINIIRTNWKIFMNFRVALMLLLKGIDE